MFTIQAAKESASSPVAESEKDKSTEKVTPTAEEKAPEPENASNTTTEPVKSDVAETSAADNTANESLNDSKVSEAGTESGEPSSAKKPKKDKVKRLFSLRSLSFGRKDKQKPKKAAKDEAAAVETTNAEAAESEKVS